jgi:hypothetical protein
MDPLSGELSIAELAALLFIISLTLIPLTIWGVWYLEQRRLSGWFKREKAAFSLKRKQISSRPKTKI